MKTSARILFVVMLVSAPASAQQPAETIGHIQKVEGIASIERGGTTLPGAVGAVLYRGDRVRTGKPGAMGIVLTDDTAVSLGSGSELAVNDYAFDPKEGKLALSIRMIKGTFAYITGQIVKLAPDSARVQTPDATIAVRGTKLLIKIEE